MEEITTRISTTAFDFDEAQMLLYQQQNETESFRFIDLKDFSEESVTLTIDKIVAGMVRRQFG